ncbi:MAG: prepilin peptidase [Bdellovibrionales bacterium]
MSSALLILVQWIFPFMLLSLAVIEDLKQRKVRNNFIIVSFVMALVLLLLQEGIQGLPVGMLSLVAAFGVGFPLFLLRVVGAGDVKLLMVLALNLDWNAVLTVACASLVWGALLGIIQILLKKQGHVLAQNLVSIMKTRTALQSQELHHIPFTVALLLGWLTHITMTQNGGVWL